jgi:hypothetical protein
MSPVLKEFLYKTGYGVIGLVISALVPFLNQNPAILGSSTVVIAGILAAVEEYFFPSTSTSSTTTQ